MKNRLLGAGFASLAAAAFAPADMATGGSGFATPKAAYAAPDATSAGSTVEATVANKTAGTGPADPVTSKATKTGDTETM